MPLATQVLEQTLKTKIKAALDEAIDENSNSDQVKQRFADNLAKAIADGVDAWIKTATVTTPPGVSVQVAFPAGTGATVAPGVGTIS
jgi:hypothetical protein